MSIKLVLCDLDGTLVESDILDVLCQINGNDLKSKWLNEQFIAHGILEKSPLGKRIGLLKGISLAQIEDKIEEKNFLLNGSHEFFKFLKNNQILSVVHSGNIEPVLKYYQHILQFDYHVSTPIEFSDGKISKAILNSSEGVDLKEAGCKKIISELGILFDEIVSIGDSPSDLNVFRLAKYSIAFNPKGGIEKDSTYVVKGDLFDVMNIMKSLL
jgi:phosphoserine phosphatase